ncbi:MAG TPA: alpha/beta hydrolase [Treponema sp.]|nr:alpha/beta hydrolase [Treponema sp.]
MSDGTEVSVNRWIPDEGSKINGIVQLSHGMAEHAMRYDRLGSILADNGWIFSAHDHRGHGKTAQHAERNGSGMFGMLAEKGGFDRVVQDIDEVIAGAKTSFPGYKVVLLGHSFGSFAAQSYIETYGSHIDACVLCGTAGPNHMLVLAGTAAAHLTALFRGKKYCSPFLKHLAFGAYTKHIPDTVNGQEWLSRDKDNVQMYLEDKWCGFNPTVSFYCDMMYGLRKVHTAANMKKIPQNLPALIAYGSEDPVGGYGKTVKKLFDVYRRNGMTDVTLKEYPEDRHEIFNEIDKDTVTDDFLAWINSRIQS